LDMVIERFGHFLIGEWKRPSEKISMGQEILLKRLATKEDIVVLLIEGDTDDGMEVTNIEAIQKDGTLIHIGTSKEALKNFIRFWYEHAEKKARGL